MAIEFSGPVKGIFLPLSSVCHFDLGDVLLGHRMLNLPGDGILEGDGTRLSKDSLPLEKIIERRSNVLISLSESHSRRREFLY
jgi:hypothetical protein